jgi:outer membrane protein OmpA-like peptidoglycan-associated protein
VNPRALQACSAFALVALLSPAAHAQALRWHLEVGAAAPLGDPQAHEYGFGVQGTAAAEVALSRALGLQLEVGSLWLPHTNRPADLTIADHGDGSAETAMLGLRVRPFTVVAGAWGDVNLGYIYTGSLSRFGVDAHVGYDWRVGGGRWDVGPYVGYLEVVQSSGELRPQDAHILSIGIHIALGAERPRPKPVPVPPPPPPKPPEPPPPPAPPPDRDKDGVPDTEDACPDVPGIHTDDPKTNGCPPAGDEVRVIEDHIEYDQVILFDTDSPHVHHASWPILEKLAKFINANPDIQEVDITGHADERGSEAHNLALSRYRAEAVKYLLVKFGVDPKRLTTVGHGFGHPRSLGHTPKDWELNRRAEFIITKVRNAEGGTTMLKQDKQEQPAATPAQPTPPQQPDGGSNPSPPPQPDGGGSP